MLTPAATAARMASNPEWKYVPSPRLANTCGHSVNGACPIQGAPSAPMCVNVEVLRSIQTAMKWQPMPAMARLPSGTLVEVLCGQPEQKYGSRLSTTRGFASAFSLNPGQARRDPDFPL